MNNSPTNYSLLKYSALVDFTIPYSNSFYQNLTEIYNLKELLYNEGIADYKGLPFMKPINDINT